jgi:hypothetical protein
MALTPLKRALRSAARRLTVPIVFGQTYGGRRDTVAAPGTVMIIMSQSYAGNAGPGTALGASYKCFASCHIATSGASQFGAQMQHPLRRNYCACSECTVIQTQNAVAAR